VSSELCLDILGTKFSITVDEEEDYLQEIFSQYRAAVENTQSISGIKEPLNIAVLTGFLLCDEINRMRLGMEEAQLNKEEFAEAEERARSLISRLDQVLGKITDYNANQ